MKRSRAGEDELNPSRNNNRSVFGQPGEAGEDRAGRGREGVQGLGAVQERGATDTPGLVTPGLKPEDSASSLSASGPPLLNHSPAPGVAKHITSCLDQAKEGTAGQLGPWAWATLCGAKSWPYLL